MVTEDDVQVAVTSEEANMRQNKRLDISRVDEGASHPAVRLEDHYRHRLTEGEKQAKPIECLASIAPLDPLMGAIEYMDDLDGFDSEGDGLDEDFMVPERTVEEKANFISTNREKLDDTMHQLLAYLHHALSSGKDAPSLSQGGASPVSDVLAATMLQCFDRHIIRTHKSSTTQFILFYLASAYPLFSDRFLGYLITKALDTSSTHMLRCSAAAYLASFVARAQFMTSGDVAAALYLCAKWASQYHAACCPSHTANVSTSMTQHAPFYAIVQAIMYIFVFRWRDLVPTDKLLRWWTVDGSFQNILISPLTPLRVTFGIFEQEKGHQADNGVIQGLRQRSRHRLCLHNAVLANGLSRRLPC